MATVQITGADGIVYNVDLTTGVATPAGASAVPPPAPAPAPAPVIPPDTTPPPAPNVVGVTLDQVYAWYHEFLGRDPDFATEAQPRVGQDADATYREIRCSVEASVYRQDHGLGPDVYCGPVSGGNVGPPPATGGGAPAPTTNIPALDALINWLRTTFAARDSILAQLQQHVGEVAANVGNAASSIQAQLAESLSKYLGPIGDVMGKFQATVGNLVQGLIPTTLSLVGAALGGVETIAAAFLNSAASVDDIVKVVTEALGGNVLPLGNFFTSALGAGFETGVTAWLDNLTKDHPEVVQHTIERALEVPNLSDSARTLLNTAKDREHSPGALVLVSALVAVALGIMGAMAEPDIENARQFAWHMNPTRTMELPDVLDARVRGFVSEDTARELSKLDGLRPELFDLYTRIRQAQPQIDAVYAAKFRGVIPVEEAHTRLTRLGFDDASVAMLDQVMLNIPNVQDVLQFLVRDVFIPEFIEAFGMDKEYPPLADEWAAKLGIPHDVMMLHWLAHWQLPSVSQGYEMFQRAKLGTPEDPTGEKALRRLLRAQGVEPFWRDPLIAIAYNPLTRVDLRRMDKIGTITDAQLLRGYLDIGYSPEQAQLLFDFTKKYNSKEKKLDLKDLTDGLKARVVSAILSGTFDEKEGRDLLAQIGYDAKEIDAFITEARLFRTETLSKKVAMLVGDLFVKGHRTEQEARTALSEHGYVQAEADLLIREWKLEKDLHAPNEVELRQRDLSASNVVAAFIEGAMTEPDARAYLKYLRYDDKEVAVLIADAKYKVAKADEKDAIETIHVMVLSGRISENDASGQLSALNITAKKRDGLLAKWQLERHGKVEKIPLSSLKDIFARAIWPEDHMTRYLRETGYSDDDITVLLALWGSQTAEKQARAAAAAAKAALKASGGTTSP